MAKFGDTPTATPLSTGVKFGDVLTTADMGDVAGSPALYAVIYQMWIAPSAGALFTWGQTGYSTVGKPTTNITAIPLPTVGLYSVVLGLKCGTSAGGTYSVEHYSSAALYRSQTLQAQVPNMAIGAGSKVGSMFINSVLATDYLQIRNVAGVTITGAELQIRLVT